MIKRLLLAIAFTLLSAVLSYGQNQQFTADHTMDELITTRAKLIDRYVFKKGFAWGVSVYGVEDVWSGDDINYLTVYVYEDSKNVFAADLALFGAPLGSTGVFTVDGIPIFVEVIQRPKGKTHERPAKTERDDRRKR